MYDANGEKLPNLLSFRQVVSEDVLGVIREIVQESPLCTHETAINELLELGAKSYRRKYGKAKR